MRFGLLMLLLTLGTPYGSAIRAQDKSLYKVQCISQDSEGNITFRIWNPKLGKRYKLENALKEGVHAVLFVGFSGSGTCQNQPALLKNTDEQNRFLKIEEEFFSKDGTWRTYVRQGDVDAATLKETETKDLIVFSVQVSKVNLRKFLEEQQIIKRLNNGF